MSGKGYPKAFKVEAVKQVVERGYSVSSVTTLLDITTHSLYARIKKHGPDSSTEKYSLMLRPRYAVFRKS
ncbi:transposase [Enterobacter hormaechei subsp. steigerwaltii]